MYDVADSKKFTFPGADLTSVVNKTT